MGIDEEFTAGLAVLRQWAASVPGDDRGTLRHLTPDRIVAASREIRTGRRVSMGTPIPGEPAPDNVTPGTHSMVQLHTTDRRGSRVTFALDELSLPIHGNASSHLDALCHVAVDGTMYGGESASTVTAAGAPRLAIDSYADGIVGRGVLLDMPAVLGVDWIEPGQAVARADLELAEHALGVTVGEGDILVFRTGHDRRRRVLGAWDVSRDGDGRAGLTLDAVVWMAERRIAAFLPDGDGETVPSHVTKVMAPIHALQIAALGLAAADALDLEALSTACREEGRYTFFVVVAPLIVVGGTGSPVNPIAIF